MRCNGQNQNVMDTLDDKALNQAYRYATALAGDRDLAMDLVHSSYLKYLNRPARVAHEPIRYFLRVVRNTFLDLKRSEARWQYDEVDAADGVVEMHAGGLENVEINKDLVRQIWDRLSAPEREVLYLWAVEEYTSGEIASLTDTPRGTLLARMHRLKKKFSSDEHKVLRMGEPS